MYYETALIDTSLLQKKVGKMKPNFSEGKLNNNIEPSQEVVMDISFRIESMLHILEEQQHGKEKSGNEEEEKPEIARADEYETLAKLCLEKKQ